MVSLFGDMSFYHSICGRIGDLVGPSLPWLSREQEILSRQPSVIVSSGLSDCSPWVLFSIGKHEFLRAYPREVCGGHRLVEAAFREEIREVSANSGLGEVLSSKIKVHGGGLVGEGLLTGGNDALLFFYKSNDLGLPDVEMLHRLMQRELPHRQYTYQFDLPRVIPVRTQEQRPLPD